jgi:hypothetical protein
MARPAAWPPGLVLSGQEAVTPADLPDVAVGIGERAGISPFLVPASKTVSVPASRATHQLVDLGIGVQPDTERSARSIRSRNIPRSKHVMVKLPG